MRALLLSVALSMTLAAPVSAQVTVSQAGDHLVLSPPLRFETHGGTLLPEDQAILDVVAAFLRAHPSMTLEIAAHTDSRGSDAFNLTVTQSIADQVRMALIARRIPAERLRATGYGETQPIAPNSTAEGRAANQRIELRVTRS
jgi:OOP family OmpA-OmpF porin